MAVGVAKPPNWRLLLPYCRIALLPSRAGLRTSQQGLIRGIILPGWARTRWLRLGFVGRLWVEFVGKD